MALVGLFLLYIRGNGKRRLFKLRICVLCRALVKAFECSGLEPGTLAFPIRL